MILRAWTLVFNKIFVTFFVNRIYRPVSDGKTYFGQWEISMASCGCAVINEPILNFQLIANCFHDFEIKCFSTNVNVFYNFDVLWFFVYLLPSLTKARTHIFLSGV